MILNRQHKIDKHVVESDSFSSLNIVVKTWIKADDSDSSSQIDLMSSAPGYLAKLIFNRAYSRSWISLFL